MFLNAANVRLSARFRRAVRASAALGSQIGLGARGVSYMSPKKEVHVVVHPHRLNLCEECLGLIDEAMGEKLLREFVAERLVYVLYAMDSPEHKKVLQLVKHIMQQQLANKWYVAQNQKYKAQIRQVFEALAQEATYGSLLQ